MSLRTPEPTRARPPDRPPARVTDRRPRLRGGDVLGAGALRALTDLGPVVFCTANPRQWRIAAVVSGYRGQAEYVVDEKGETSPPRPGGPLGGTASTGAVTARPTPPSIGRSSSACGTTVDYGVRRTADGRTKREIIRCLKRFLAREIYQRVMTDFRARRDVAHAA